MRQFPPDCSSSASVTHRPHCAAHDEERPRHSRRRDVTDSHRHQCMTSCLGWPTPQQSLARRKRMETPLSRSKQIAQSGWPALNTLKSSPICRFNRHMSCQDHIASSTLSLSKGLLGKRDFPCSGNLLEPPGAGYIRGAIRVRSATPAAHSDSGWYVRNGQRGRSLSQSP